MTWTTCIPKIKFLQIVAVGDPNVIVGKMHKLQLWEYDMKFKYAIFV